MDSHTVAELLSGLASRTNNLAVSCKGQDSRALLKQQDILTKLAMAAIVEDLDESTDAYIDSTNALNDAIASANAAIKDIKKVTKTIADISKVLDIVTKLVAL